jgi:hypothetical protein
MVAKEEWKFKDEATSVGVLIIGPSFLRMAGGVILSQDPCGLFLPGRDT